MLSSLVHVVRPVPSVVARVCTAATPSLASQMPSICHGPLIRTCRTDAVTSGDANVKTIRQEFKKQATLYAPHPKALEFVMREVGEVSGIALDVASGTGVFAMALAPFCENVTSFDATPEMQARASETAADLGIRNIFFQLGDASSMPYPDGSFDVVVSRLAIHHFANPGAIVNEMARVCKPGGRVILSDIIADNDPEIHAETDRLEILRDPSHTSCPTLEGLYRLLNDTRRLQLKAHSGNIYMHPVNLDFWMKNTETPQAQQIEISNCMRRELNGGRVTGMNPFLDENGELTFLHRYVVVEGVRF